jgi:hypothetical protein
MEAVRIGSSSNLMFITPLYTMSPCEGFRNSPPSSFPPRDALYAYGLFFSPYSETFQKVTVFAIIAVLFSLIG